MITTNQPATQIAWLMMITTNQPANQTAWLMITTNQPANQKTIATTRGHKHY